MKKIGVTGGIGSGKSSVLAFLEKNGAVVYQADLIAHDLQKKGTACYQQMIAEFGTTILDDLGNVNRKRLAEIVFSDERKLKRLNHIIHPEVEKKIVSLMEEEAKKGTQIFVLEAALMKEEFYRTMFDEIWYLYVPEEIRLQRLMESRGYTAERTRQIMTSQPTEEEFMSLCDWKIDNSGNLDQTEQMIREKLKEMGYQ